MPGGFAEIGLPPAENVKKEVFEEACMHVVVDALYGVRHKAKGPFKPDVRDFYKLYFLCEPLSDTPPEPGTETLAVDFFSLDELPDLCTDRTIVEDIERAFAFRNGQARSAWFD